MCQKPFPTLSVFLLYDRRVVDFVFTSNYQFLNTQKNYIGNAKVLVPYFNFFSRDYLFYQM